MKIQNVLLASVCFIAHAAFSEVITSKIHQIKIVKSTYSQEAELVVFLSDKTQRCTEIRFFESALLFNHKYQLLIRAMENDWLVKVQITEKGCIAMDIGEGLSAKRYKIIAPLA